ncbi:hypothetical protein DQ04_00061240 [Trypanosoma grayi]|uniref:hypothetical protein n=1 Tax=Trypanosoma grayi TaxID=71804 RepID=UPI0004F47A95|nr:hypothetical protein DQ04_00061240 [Trypanosoma grayi]KEG15486.1 hypothetical protein DQ04_00061240 [Trypanosoma grayi]
MGVLGHSTSNYPTAHNHCFRTVSSYDANLHTKRKCSTCGIWGEKGSRCTLCGDSIPGPRPRPTGSRLSSRSTSSSVFQGVSRDENAFKPPKPFRPQEPVKVKCSYCGIWVTPASVCQLCRTPA